MSYASLMKHVGHRISVIEVPEKKLISPAKVRIICEDDGEILVEEIESVISVRTFKGPYPKSSTKGGKVR